MSYEGRVQKLCFRCNYYEEQNCYVETDRCPYCNCEWGKSNDVDDTNGEADGYDHSMVPESCFNTDSIIQSLRTELEETKKKLSEARAGVSGLVKLCQGSGPVMVNAEFFRDAAKEVLAKIPNEDMPEPLLTKYPDLEAGKR